MADTPARHGMTWTEDDYMMLLNLLDSGWSLAGICKRLERTTASIEPKASKFGYEFENATGRATKVATAAGGSWGYGSYKGIYDKWLERKRKLQPPEKQQLCIDKSRQVGMTTLAEWAARASAVPLPKTGRERQLEAMRKHIADLASAASVDYSALEARASMWTAPPAALQGPLRWDELANRDWKQQQGSKLYRHPMDHLLHRTDKGVKHEVFYVNPEMLDGIIAFKSQRRRFVDFEATKDELRDAQAYAYKALTESLKPIQDRQVDFLRKYFAKGGTIERTLNPGAKPQPKETTMNCDINPGAKPQPKETTMNCDINPKSFQVKVQTTYVFNGTNLNYATDAMVYTYIKQVEDQIKELKGIETASQKKAAEIEGLQAVAAKLSTFLDNRQELQNSAYSERETVLAAPVPNEQVKDLEAKALSLQIQLLQLQVERDALSARVAAYEKIMNPGASNIRFSDPQV